MTQCNIYPCLIYSRKFCRISASKEVVELYSPTPFGAMLKQLREEVGMSQGELADDGQDRSVHQQHREGKK